MSQRWLEFVIQGPRGWTVGFLQGFVAGRRPGVPVFDAEAEGCEVTTVRERIRELIDRTTETAHVLVVSDAADVAREAIERAGELGRDVAVRLERPIGSAELGFSFECFSRESADRIRGYFRNLPSGVRVSAGAKLEEFVDPDAVGAEVYAPVHDFELRGTGALLGDVEGVIRMRRLLGADELTDCGKIRLVEV